MKKDTKAKSQKSTKVNVIKSVSLPSALFVSVESRIRNEADMDFSKYIRRLIRADLQAA